MPASLRRGWKVLRRYAPHHPQNVQGSETGQTGEEMGWQKFSALHMNPFSTRAADMIPRGPKTPSPKDAQMEMVLGPPRL